MLGVAVELLTDLVLSAGLEHALGWALGLPSLLLLTMLMLLRPFLPIAAAQRPYRTGVSGAAGSMRGWPDRGASADAAGVESSPCRPFAAATSVLLLFIIIIYIV